MKNNVEKGNDQNPKESFNYRNNTRNLIDPFILTDDLNEKINLGNRIANILDRSNDDLLGWLKSTDENAYLFYELIKKIRKMLREEIISKDAPWLRMLEDKIITLELLLPNIEKEMDLKKGKHDAENTQELTAGSDWGKDLESDIKKFWAEKKGLN